MPYDSELQFIALHFEDQRDLTIVEVLPRLSKLISHVL